METTASAKETLRRFFADHEDTELTKGDIEQWLKTLGVALKKKQEGDAPKSGKGGRGKRVCWNFQNTGKCSYGDECRFKHEATNSVRKTLTESEYDELLRLRKLQLAGSEGVTPQTDLVHSSKYALLIAPLGGKKVSQS